MDAERRRLAGGRGCLRLADCLVRKRAAIALVNDLEPGAAERFPVFGWARNEARCGRGRPVHRFGTPV
jgi:hypothetical protein